MDPYKECHLEMVMDGPKQPYGRRRGETPVPYGYCPQCGAPGIKRSKPSRGDDWCVGFRHAYPSDHALVHPTAAPHPLVGTR